MSPIKLKDAPYGCLHQICRILDGASNAEENWKALASKIGIYTQTDINNFARSASPTESLLSDWSLTGSNVDELFTLIFKICNRDAFDFLKKSGFVTKSLSDSLNLSNISEQRPTGQEQIPPCFQNINNNNSNQNDRSIVSVRGTNLDSQLFRNVTDKDLSLSIVSEQRESMSDNEILQRLRNTGLIEFSYHEICCATNNFNDSNLSSGGCKLGEGSFGSVYKGELKNTVFAIKKLSLKETMQSRSAGLGQFAVEVLTLTRYRHPNLLELAGYSLDPKAPCLIYYYMENGSLESLLQSQKSCQIDWKTRFKIAEDIAKGLVFLHTASDKPLIHRDLKCANVLLTHEYHAKIGDFGLARLGSEQGNSIVMTNRLQGTMGYISPEAALGNISTKTDTYSYGVMLLELLTNLRAFDPNRGCENQSLVALVENLISKDKDLSGIISHRGVKWPYVVAEEFLAVSQICFNVHSLRPKMTCVLDLISTNLERYSNDTSLESMRWIVPCHVIVKPPQPFCEDKKTVLVFAANQHQSNVAQQKISKMLDSDTKKSSLRAMEDMEFHFMTSYDSILIVCHPTKDFSRCFQDALKRFNPHFVVSVGLCQGVRGRVELGDVILCKSVVNGPVIYPVGTLIETLSKKILIKEADNTALWKLPGVLPRPPNTTASQSLLWISKLLMELNTEQPEESAWLKSQCYDHSIGFIDNMKTYTTLYPCLSQANMQLFVRPNNTLDPTVDLKVAVMNNADISLSKKHTSPTLQCGTVSAGPLPYMQGMAFNRSSICQQDILGHDSDIFTLYKLCTVPCVAVKGVCGFNDPYEDYRFEELACHASMAVALELISTFLSK